VDDGDERNVAVVPRIPTRDPVMNPAAEWGDGTGVETFGARPIIRFAGVVV